MIRNILLASCLLVAMAINAQRNRVKLGLIGIPLFQSGYGMGTIGYERLNKTQTASWQAHLNIAGGSFAADAEITTRRWITIEKTFYIKTDAKKTQWSFSPFIEIGSRNITPGYGGSSSDSILQNTKAFEINPGASLGLLYRFSELWGLGMQAGPKLVIADRNQHYINAVSRQKFKIPDNEIRAGFMFTASFYFQF